MFIHDETDGADPQAVDWFIATDSAGRNVTSVQPFSRVHQVGQRLMSLSHTGFRLRRSPLLLYFEPDAMEMIPWTVWRVRPIRPLEHRRFTGALRVRGFDVLERMPDGYEFGVHGADLKAFLHHVAGLDPWATTTTEPDRPYNEAMRTWRLRRELSDDEHDLYSHAREYLDVLRKRHGRGDDARQSTIDDLVQAILTATPIPAPIADAWHITSTGRPQLQRSPAPSPA